MVSKENIVFGAGIALLVAGFAIFAATQKMELLLIPALLGVVLLVTGMGP